MNSCTFVGRMTRDPEARTTSGGKQLAKFCVAVNGNGKDDTTFVECEAWGQTAEFVSRYFQKGKPIAVSGRLRQDRWDDKATGAKRTSYVLNVRDASFVPSEGARRDAGAEAGADVDADDVQSEMSIPF